MPIQKVNNVKFHYELLGDKKKQPLVFISGYTGNINAWRGIASQLKDDFYILIFDNQGIRKTEDDGDFLSIQIMADNISGLINASGLKNPIIAGFAMGSTIAQTIAYQHPKHVRQLVLISALMKWRDHAKQLCEKLCSLREEGKFNEYAKIIYDTCFSDVFKKHNPSDSFVKQLSGILINSQSTHGQRRQVEALKAFDSTQWVSHINVPTIVISPELDQFATPTESKLLSDQMKCEYLIIKNCGHAILDEKSDELIAIFRDCRKSKETMF